ncbi:HAD-IIB family hydrolase [Marispirochaeta sp.]|jgi:HAD superfamily hydrolase (TIGR01484 family)|uniref:HAD-IIB family hydrolase n=1 Tax=Marispirochaeta sp. TaxID=2038653 RepID=UPI0029C824A9|nr:HAD-IIB family hydrolase [Marispirochaeta sp.]
MQPIAALPESTSRRIGFVLCDIDDTLTRNGFLLAQAYNALWRLYQTGVKVIPVTGRPAGWCDMIIRQWPVDAVIGENGAFAMLRTAGGYDLSLHSSVAGEEVKRKLDGIRDFVLGKISGLKVAKDQAFRWFDLAFDFAEDPPRFGMDTAVKIKELCEQKGAIAKISSIHVNTWFGDYSKLDMARELLSKHYTLTDREQRERVFFCGDSPNDEPMFSYFPLSCGVENIRTFLEVMKNPPSFVTRTSHGEGFAEAAEIILTAHKGTE